MLIKKELETLSAATLGNKNSGMITYHTLPRCGKIMQIAAYNEKSKLAAQIFLDGKNFCSRTENGVWDDTICKNMASIEMHYSSRDVKYSVAQSDIEKAKAFLKVSHIWNNTVSDIVLASSNKKALQIAIKKQNQTDLRMKKYRKYLSLNYITKREHEKLSRFCRDKVFDLNFGLIDHKKTQNCICGKCRKTFQPETKVKVGMTGRCPKCGIKLFYVTEKTRIADRANNRSFLYCKRQGNGDLIVAKIGANISVRKEKTEYQLYSESIHVYQADKKGSFLYFYYNGSYFTSSGWKERKNEYIYGRYHTGYFGIYTVPVFPNLDKVFGEKWCNVEITKIMRDHNIPEYDLDDLLQKTYSGYTEMFVKNGLFSFLHTDFEKLRYGLPIRAGRHSFADTFKMLPEERKVYVKCQVTPEEHFKVLAQYPNEYHSAAEIEKMRRLHYSGSEELVKRGYKLEKILNYIDKQVKKTGNSADICKIYWEDYLKTCNQCSLELLTDRAEFPENIEEAHDRVVSIKAEIDRVRLEELARKRAEAQEKAYLDAFKAYEEGKLDVALDAKFMDKFEKVKKKLSKVGSFTNGIYSIIMPQTLTDFALEGTCLNNCVFSSAYYKKHASSESYIFFLRRSADEKRPFYCLEISPEGNLKQLRGYCNCEAPEDVKAFAGDFLSYYANKMHIVRTEAS